MIRAACGAVLPCFLLVLATACQAGLVAYYDFNESSGTTANDSVGTADGTLSNNASFLPGAGVNGSGALQLSSASNDYVSMGNQFDYTTTSFSLEAWVLTSPGETGGMVPVSRHWSTHVAGYALGVGDVGDGTPGSAPGTSLFYTTYPTSGVSSTLVNDGAWHQLVGVYNVGDGTVSIYVDGQLESSAAGAAFPLPSAAAPFMVGGYQAADTSLIGVFTGLIDDVAVYDNALSSSDVLAIYESRLSPTAVPEPASLTLVGLGAVGMAIGAYRRRRAVHRSPVN